MGKRLGSSLISIVLVLCSEIYGKAGPLLATAGDPQSGSTLTHWTFKEDFNHGIPGWVSYPLFQDVGYDPTIYTKEVRGSAVLVRDMVSNGERLQRVGMIRSLKFHMGQSASFRIIYELETCGQLQDLRLVLGDTKRRRNSYVLPFEPGAHDVRIDGRQLGLPSNGVDVETIVLEAEVALPPRGCHSQLTLRALQIDVEREGTLSLRAPSLDWSSVQNIAVSKEIVTPVHPLNLDLGPGGTARIDIYDEEGMHTLTQSIPAGEVREIQVAAPGKPGLYRAEIRSGRVRTDFRFLALARIPDHPRVLLQASRLEQLRSQPNSNQLLTIVHQRASDLRHRLTYNTDAGANIELLPADNAIPGLDEFYDYIYSYSDSIAFNALDFRLNGDRQALEAARRGLATVSAWTTWTPPWFVANGLDTHFGIGIFTEELAFGYDLVASELSQEEKSKIADALWKKSVLPSVNAYFLYDHVPINATNHLAHSVGGAIEACVALYGDDPEWTARFGPALAELLVAYEHVLDGLILDDGSEDEPARYQEFGMEGMSWGLAPLDALGIRPRGFAKMMQSFWWLRYAQVRPGLVLDTGDTGWKVAERSGFAWGAEFTNDPALRSFYESATNLSLKSGSILSGKGPGGVGLPGLLDLLCCTRDAEPLPSPPPSRIFAERGSAILRSGWGPQDTVISLRVGPWFNHEHHDQGSFLVAAHGEELVSEAGYAHYDNETDLHFHDFFTQAPAHNTIILDNDPFSQEDYDGRYWPPFQDFPKFQRYVLSPGIDYLSANLAPAYRDGDPVTRLTRDYLFLKPDILVVHDQMEAPAPHEYAWLLHIPPGAQTSMQGNQALIHGKAAFAVITNGGENRPWSLERQPIPAYGTYSDFDGKPVEPRETFRLDSAREKAGHFLVGMHFQAAGEESTPLQVFQTTSGEGFRSPDGSAQVLFRRQAGELNLGDLTAESDVLAIRNSNGEEEVFGGNLKDLRRGKDVLLSANPATDVTISQPSAPVEIHVFCSAKTDLIVNTGKTPREVSLDRTLVKAPRVADSLTFGQLAKGEHIISIRY